jgi:uncharacterized surface protein with fasciclin (FAS1) repeats
LELVKSNADFSILAAAVEAADPAFAEALSSTELFYTVFAPTNEAFEALFKTLGVTAEEVLKNPELLNAVLAYHVVPGGFIGAALADLDGVYLGTALPDRGVNGDGAPASALAVKVADGTVTLISSAGGSATVTTADVRASNGLAHVINGVLLPFVSDKPADPNAAPEDVNDASIAVTIVALSKRDNPEFFLYWGALSNGNPRGVTALDKQAPLTVFAPTDSGFAAALKATNTSAGDLINDKEKLNVILAYHVVPGDFKIGTLMAASDKLGPIKLATLLTGTSVSFVFSAGKTSVNDIEIKGALPKNTNGRMMVIEGVLLPPPPPSK